MKIFPLIKSCSPWFLTCLAIALAVVSARIPVLHWLSFFWILPFAVVLSKLQLKQAIIISTFCGTVFWICTTYWLVAANIDFAKSDLIPVVIVFLLFCLWQAMPYIVLGVSYSYFNCKKSPLGPLLAASALTIAWVLIPTPIPLIPQNSLYIYPKFVAVLDLSGMSLLLFTSTLYCFAIEYCFRKNAIYKKHYMGLVLGIPVLMLAYGELRQWQLDAAKTNAASDQWLHVGYVQPVLKFDEPFDRTYQLTEQLIKERAPELIVWPEISAPYSYINSNKDKALTQSLVNRHWQDLLIVSGYVYTGEWVDEQKPIYYNQAQLIKDKRLQGQYSKEILVPFFEYMPKALSFLRQWMPRVLYYQPGANQQPLPYKDHIQLVVAICYEVIFPDYVRRQIQSGGNILINPVNDAVFQGGIGGFYHLSTAYFRVIENRVPWVRATNTGVSLIVADDGKLLTQPSQANDIMFASAKVYVPLKASVYGRVGDWFLWVLVIVWLSYFALVRMR